MSRTIEEQYLDLIKEYSKEFKALGDSFDMVNTKYNGILENIIKLGESNKSIINHKNYKDFTLEEGKKASILFDKASDLYDEYETILNQIGADYGRFVNSISDYNSLLYNYIGDIDRCISTSIPISYSLRRDLDALFAKIDNFIIEATDYLDEKNYKITQDEKSLEEFSKTSEELRTELLSILDSKNKNTVETQTTNTETMATQTTVDSGTQTDGLPKNKDIETQTPVKNTKTTATQTSPEKKAVLQKPKKKEPTKYQAFSENVVTSNPRNSFFAIGVMAASVALLALFAQSFYLAAFFLIGAVASFGAAATTEAETETKVTVEPEKTKQKTLEHGLALDKNWAQKIENQKQTKTSELAI